MPALLKSLAARPWTVALLLGALAEALFLFNIGYPTKNFFDEVHYVPAAQALLDLSVPRNIEHPLLGKELIALGMALFGDNPWGWRLVPSLFGAATVSGGFALIWVLTGRLRPAVTAALLLILNQMVFIQARIAMLDVFLGAFLLWAMVLLLMAMRAPPEQVVRRWIAGSVLLGLAVAVKWSAIPYVALAGLAFLWLKRQDPGRWQGLGAIKGLALMALSIPVYFLIFVPAFFYAEDPVTLVGLIPLQVEMYDLQTQVLKEHTYQSNWYSWPLMLRPIWYFYEYYDGAQRGVLLVGNPLVMWGGLVAVVACYGAWLATVPWVRRLAVRCRRFVLQLLIYPRSPEPVAVDAPARVSARKPLAMALLWTASLAIYVVIPKSLGFYYYYYLSGIFLCFALAVAFDHFDRGRDRGWSDWFVAASFLMFVYFYPIISAIPLGGERSFEKWMWLPGWP